MTQDRYTEHGTEDTGQHSPEGVLHGVPLAPSERSPQEDTGTAELSSEVSSGTSSSASLRERFSAWRTSRARTAQEDADEARLARQRRDAERDRLRDVAVRTANARRKASSRGRTDSGTDEDRIAPVPQYMRWVGIWIGRIFGALPLLAPLGLSGYFTMQVFTSEPLKVPFLAALLATLALEGGVWKLATLLDRTMLEGDSTISLRLSLALYLGIISGVIYWHADHEAKLKGFVDGALHNWEWVPAGAAAAFSLLGVRIWTHTARFKHRKALREAGRVDKQAPKFAVLSWILCPIETPLALRHAVKYRIEGAVEAVEDRRFWRASGKPAVWPEPQDVPDALEDGEEDGTELPPRYVPSIVGTRNALPSGTGQDGTGQDRTLALPVGGTEQRDGTGQRDSGTGQNSGTDVPRERDRTDTGVDVLKHMDSLLIVTEAYRDTWRTKTPSVRNIRDAIHAHRQQVDGGSFRSISVAQEIQKALIQLQADPGLLPANPSLEEL